ncbi:uncharacterized protein LOC109142424 isoform X1 [Larimichthys crocea]|uniref:uncharacterized protein LOC109142424 isoform X1 n=1 Tax=Larimichthys crocea TaxID=215358 RepID=UPI000F5EB4EF|nr:uncharacterized protein LOC109142424 isoform X1 [Larimichthys crocea]
MEAGAIFFLLLFALPGPASTASFYGDSISFMPPHKNEDGTYKVTFHHRQNGRSNCQDQSSYSCESGVCTSFDKSSVLQTDQDATGQGRWCQTEGQTTATIRTNKNTFSLSGSGCCWESNVEGKTNWTSDAELNLGTRSDSRTINSCPVTTAVSSLRVPQNCFSRFRLLAHDPDGDSVKCRFTSGTTVPSNFSLDEASCTLTSTGQVVVGVHVFEVMLEDFPTKNVTMTYADGSSEHREASNTTLPPLCKVKLQFSMEILPAIPNCEAGHVQPMFLSTTPSHGDVLYASVARSFQIKAKAQAHHSSIHDFQVSGPHNMSKVLTDESLGKAELTLSWTPQQSDLYRFVPICFTAETNETQSEMRCVIVMVTPASIVQGKATVQCLPNKMVVALEKASMPGIDENYLKLRDQSCSLTSNSTHIMATMSLSTCGTKLEDKGDFIVFKNHINSFELPDEVIIRRRTVKIDFFCQFPKSISISSYYKLHNSDYIFTESSFGSFSYTFEIFRDSNFTNKWEASAYPVEVMLLDQIYMGIQAQSDLPNVKLFVESCKATPDDNPENPISYDIIKNGCLKDETVKVYPTTDLTSYNFQVQAFKFTGNYDQVYITCSVILCEAESSFSRCAQGCLSDASRRRRRRRGFDKETVGHYITQGPLRFVRAAVPDATLKENTLNENTLKENTLKENTLKENNDKKNEVKENSDEPIAVTPPPVSSDTKSSGWRWGIREILSTNTSTIVFASGFVVSMLLMAVLVCFFTKKRKAEDRKFLLDSSW